MFGKIVVGFDGSDQSRDALALARVLAGPSGGSVVAGCVYAYEPIYSKAGGDDAEYHAALRRDAEGILKRADGATQKRTIACSSAARGIRELAETENADLVVVGSTHHGAIGKVLIGSVGEKLLHGSPCPVAVAPKGFAEAPDLSLSRIAVGYDASPESERALDLAITLAREAGGTLRLYTAVEPTGGSNAFFPSDADWASHNEAMVNRAHETLRVALDALPAELQASGDVLFGTAAEALSNEVRTGADLLVMGSRGYGPVRGVIAGRVSADLARSAPRPLIVVPRAAALPREAGGAEVLATP